MVDEKTRELLRRHLEEFGKWILQLAQPREFVRHACEMDVHFAAA